MGTAGLGVCRGPATAKDLSLETNLPLRDRPDRSPSHESLRVCVDSDGGSRTASVLANCTLRRPGEVGSGGVVTLLFPEAFAVRSLLGDVGAPDTAGSEAPLLGPDTVDRAPCGTPLLKYSAGSGGVWYSGDSAMVPLAAKCSVECDLTGAAGPLDARKTVGRSRWEGAGAMAF